MVNEEAKEILKKIYKKHPFVRYYLNKLLKNGYTKNLIYSYREIKSIDYMDIIIYNKDNYEDLKSGKKMIDQYKVIEINNKDGLVFSKFGSNIFDTEVSKILYD